MTVIRQCGIRRATRARPQRSRRSRPTAARNPEGIRLISASVRVRWVLGACPLLRQRATAQAHRTCIRQRPRTCQLHRSAVRHRHSEERRLTQRRHSSTAAEHRLRRHTRRLHLRSISRRPITHRRVRATRRRRHRSRLPRHGTARHPLGSAPRRRIIRPRVPLSALCPLAILQVSPLIISWSTPS